jgi:hypothetical protein
VFFCLYCLYLNKSHIITCLSHSPYCRSAFCRPILLSPFYYYRNHYFLLMPPIRDIPNRPLTQLNKAALVNLAQQLALNSNGTVLELRGRIRQHLDQYPDALCYELSPVYFRLHFIYVYSFLVCTFLPMITHSPQPYLLSPFYS